MKANTWANKPLRYYSRKRSLSSRKPVQHKHKFGLRPVNKYDTCTTQELHDYYERALNKLEALPTGSMRLYNLIVADIKLLQTSKNWIK